MRYQLNGNYTTEDGLTLIDPQWEFTSAMDKVLEKICTAEVKFYGGGYTCENARTILTFSYEYTWEDYDVIERILQLPAFVNSTLVESW